MVQPGTRDKIVVEVYHKEERVNVSMSCRWCQSLGLAPFFIMIVDTDRICIMEAINLSTNVVRGLSVAHNQPV